MENMYIYDYFEITQPIGDLFSTVIPAEVIIKISASNTRTAYNDKGVQRKLNSKRVNDIATFCNYSDAMFPTPIVLSASSRYVEMEDGKIRINYREIIRDEKYCSIIDGQHRLKGISKSGKASKFNLPVLFVFDTDVHTEARLFSIINGKQKPINKSLIYDLSRMTNMRTVERFCSETVNYLNTNKNSQLYHKIKMLGYKEHKESFVSQSALVNSLMDIISKDVTQDNLKLDNNEKPDEYEDQKHFILREYFINGEDAKVRKLTLNFFNAWMRNLKEFNLVKTLIGKTIGFNSAVEIFQQIFLNFREKKLVMSEENYYDEIKKILDIYTNNLYKKLDINDAEIEEDKNEKVIKEIRRYGSSASGARSLTEDLLKIYKKIK